MTSYDALQAFRACMSVCGGGRLCTSMLNISDSPAKTPKPHQDMKPAPCNAMQKHNVQEGNVRKGKESGQQRNMKKIKGRMD